MIKEYNVLAFTTTNECYCTINKLDGHFVVQRLPDAFRF